MNSDRLVIEFKTEEDLLRQLKAIKVYKEIELHKLGPSVKDTGIRCSDKAAVRAYMKQADARAAEINGELRRIFVITSYSIHYTKLYEFELQRLLNCKLEEVLFLQKFVLVDDPVAGSTEFLNDCFPCNEMLFRKNKRGI